MKTLKYILPLALLISACGSSDEPKEQDAHEGHDHSGHDHEGHDHGEHANVITFHDEDVKAEGLVVRKVKNDTVYEMIHSSGEVVAAPGEEMAITAKTSGVLVFIDPNLAHGKKVAAGTSMFTIVGQGMTNYSLKADYQKARSVYDQAQSEFERKKELYESKAISKADYERAKMEMEVAKAELDRQTEYFSQGGKRITSGMDGWVGHIYKSSGEYVEVGEKIATVTGTQNLHLVGYVPLSWASKLENLHSASFNTGDGMYDLKNMSGELVAYARTVDPQHPKIPVTYKFMNDGTVVPGSYAEIDFRLTTDPVRTGVIIPRSALLDDYGRYQVVEKVHAEEYILKTVKVGAADGDRVEIVKGLQEGDLVVTRGAFRIKMASMGGEIGHGHSH